MIKDVKEILQIPTERRWYDCKKCGQHLLIHSDTARCNGIYIKCKKCGNEEEIKI